MDAQDLPPPETLFETRWLRVCRRGRWDYVERAHGNGHAVVIVAVTPLIVGLDRVIDTARRMGVTSELEPVPSMRIEELRVNTNAKRNLLEVTVFLHAPSAAWRTTASWSATTTRVTAAVSSSSSPPPAAG